MTFSLVWPLDWYGPGLDLRTGTAFRLVWAWGLTLRTGMTFGLVWPSVVATALAALALVLVRPGVLTMVRPVQLKDLWNLVLVH